MDDYLPLAGGTMQGSIKMSNGTHIDGLDQNGQNFRMLTFEGGSGLTYKAGTNNEYNVINRKAMVSYVANAIDNIDTGGGYVVPEWTWINVLWDQANPGNWGMVDRNNQSTSRFVDCRGIWFTSQDRSGNRAFNDADWQDIQGYFPGPLYIQKMVRASLGLHNLLV